MRGQDAPEETPPRRAEQVTVTAIRSDARVADTPASVAVVPRAALDATAAPTVDDALRQVVGFSLFRRTGSRAANPTAQGVSLRGLGASGASRALVLADGLPLNDPFGGWVNWARVPRASIELEVLRGGASDLYGSGALGGVVQIVTRSPSAGRGLEAEASAGGASTLVASLSTRGRHGEWSGRLSAQAFRTDGYVPVDEWSRGPVDTEAASRHAAVDATVERRAFGDGRAFVRGMAYGEDRENGTPLQVNDPRIGLGATGLDWGAPERGRGSVRLWGSTQVFHQAFTAVASDRSGEDLTRRQRVPATAVGFSAQWSRLLGARHRLLAGAEAQQVEGTTEETVFARGAATSTVYRSFRVGDTLTLANPELEAERLSGGEAGTLATRGPVSLRVTAFVARVQGAVANVTVSTTPGLVTRQRRNVGRVRSRGLEAEAELLLGSRGAVTAGYALTDARVQSFPDDPALEGRRLPQVPRHQATLQVRYESRWRVGLQARSTSAAFEDDRNQLALDAALQVDVSAGRAIGSGLEVFAAAENLFDAEVVVARTPVPSVGAPRLQRAGVRLRLF